MTGRIVLIDDSVDPRSLNQSSWPAGSHLLLLYWAADDVVKRALNGAEITCHRLPEIVDGLDSWERRAADLAVAICDGGPTLGGLPWRRLVEEPLYREALEVVAIYDAFAMVRRLLGPRAASRHVDLRLAPQRRVLWHALAAPPGVQGTPQSPETTAVQDAVHAGPSPRPSLGSRLMRRLRRVAVTGDVRGQLWNLLDQLDGDYRWRLRWNRRRSPPAMATGGITFFSSYLNNSHNLRLIEDGLGEPPQWVVTNRYARIACAGTGGQVFDLYRFADGDPLTPPLETPLPDLEPIVSAWNRHGLAPTAVRQLLTTWLRQSPTWGYWQGRGQRALANLAGCWRRYLDLARPRLIVMANQWSLEGWLTHEARQRGIPVLQVLHGILSGDYYTGRPIRSDRLLVGGEFWRRLWPASEQACIDVVRPADSHPTVPRQPSASAPRVTFFSWPFDRLAFYNSHELLDGFIHLFQGLLAAGSCRLQVRCHPLENPADIVDRWRQLHGEMPSGVRLSHDEPLKNVIATTDLAVMFRSTTMLDCLTNDIPFLMPGWIDFTWRQRLEGFQGIHVADDFDDLSTTLRAWLKAPPTLTSGQRDTFLSQTLDDGSELRRVVEDMVATQRGAV